MVSVKLLNMARTIGLENLSQLRNVGKVAMKTIESIGNGETPKDFRAVLKLNGKQVDILKSMPLYKYGSIGSRPYNNKIIEYTKKYAPTAYSQNKIHIFDMQFKGLSPHSGIFEVVLHDTAGTNMNKLKVLFNKAGQRLKISGNNSEIGAVQADVTVPNLRRDKFNPIDFVKRLTLKEADGMTHLRLPKSSQNGITAAIDLKAPSGYLDRITNITSGGEFYNTAELMDKIKTL